jgi:hypothetical protein
LLAVTYLLRRYKVSEEWSPVLLEEKISFVTPKIDLQSHFT